ncbi:MAG: hypothetical protein IKI63_00670 [Clostridia bacterium]|nr:hypothetical protein [Clostridia bacterium]
MKRLLSMLCVAVCLFAMVALTGCGDPAEDEKARQIKQSGIDIFDVAVYENCCESGGGESSAKTPDYSGSMTDPNGAPLCASYEINLGGPVRLVERFADPALFALVGDTLIYQWIDETTDGQSAPPDRMADLTPDGARPPVLSGNTELSRDAVEILFCEGVPNIGDYLFSQRPELTRVYLPDSVTEIGEHAFAEGCQTTIYCHRGSCAEQYAKDHGLSYQLI